MAAQRKIVAFRQDDRGDWVADLDCGHSRHMRHNPPWTLRPWTLTAEGRNRFLGHEIACKECPGPDPAIRIESNPSD